MKKVKSIALSTIAITLLGSAAMANATPLTTNTTVTTTVLEAGAITASYQETDQITAGKLDYAKNFGQITLTGFKEGTQYNDVMLSDTAGVSGRLTFTSPEGNTFQANSYGIGINGNAGAYRDPLKPKLDLSALIGQTIAPGKYSDAITVTVSNQ